MFPNSICDWEVYIHFQRGFLRGKLFVGRKLLGESFQGKILHWGIYQKSYAKFVSFVLLSLSRLNYACGGFLGNCIWLQFSGWFFLEGISAGEILHGELPPGEILPEEIYGRKNFDWNEGESRKKFLHR